MKYTKDNFFGLTQEDLKFIQTGKAADLDKCENFEDYLKFKKIEGKTAEFMRYFSIVGWNFGLKNPENLQDFCQVCYTKYLGEIAPKTNWKMNINEMMSFITKSCIRHYMRSDEYKVLCDNKKTISLDNEIKSMIEDDVMTYINIPPSYNVPSPSKQYEIDRINDFTFGYLAKECPTLYLKTSGKISHDQLGEMLGCSHQYISIKLKNETPKARDEAQRRDLDFSVTR